MGLLAVFAAALQQRATEKYLTDASRTRKPCAGRKLFAVTVEDKLFFILLYHKVYPTFDTLSFLYNRDRCNVWRATNHLAPVLESGLGKKLSLAERAVQAVEEVFEAVPQGKEGFPGGPERPIQRPKNK